jgi:cell division protein FtsI (penicillin-binding protein 3)
MLVAMVLCFVALVARLAYVQGFNAKRYAAISESQRLHTEPLPGARGAIFDRNGRELALSVRQSTIWANPRLVTDPATQAEALAPVLQIDAGQLRDKLSRDAAFIYLARTVPDAVASQVKALDLPGIFLIDEPKRFTPASDLAAPLLGKVGTDNEGLSGLELQFEKTLAGRQGEVVVEQDPSGVPYPGGVRKTTPSKRGDDLVLTIDRSLQYQAEQTLANEIVTSHAKGGMALVMDAKSGEILASASLIADPNGGPPQQAPDDLSVTRVYEPGSVAKLITIGAALEQRTIKPDDSLLVPGTIKVGDHVFSEHDPHPTQRWTITDIVANSSNVGSIMIGQKLGKDNLDKYFRSFGFGQVTGLGTPGESRGLMLDPKKWSGTSIATIPIGQGIAVTSTQVLAAYNTVANGGVYVAPKLVKATVDAYGVEHATPASVQRRVISAKTAAQLTAMLTEVTRVGTGQAARIDGYTVAGKTGTARKPLEGARGYKEGAYMSSFAGFVPAEKPAFTSLVVLDEPTPIYGGLVSAPPFAEIARYALRQFRIPPPIAAQIANVPPADPTAAKSSGDAGDVDAGAVSTTTLPGRPAQPATGPGSPAVTPPSKTP